MSRLFSMDTTSGIKNILNHSTMDSYYSLLNEYPLNSNIIHKYQRFDTTLFKALKDDPRFSTTSMFNAKPIIYQPIRLKRQFIVIHIQVQFPAIRWLYNILEQIGVTRLTPTLTAHFWLPQMSQMINRVVKNCTHCQSFIINTQK